MIIRFRQPQRASVHRGRSFSFSRNIFHALFSNRRETYQPSASGFVLGAIFSIGKKKQQSPFWGYHKCPRQKFSTFRSLGRQTLFSFANDYFAALCYNFLHDFHWSDEREKNFGWKIIISAVLPTFLSVENNFFIRPSNEGGKIFGNRLFFSCFGDITVEYRIQQMSLLDEDDQSSFGG